MNNKIENKILTTTTKLNISQDGWLPAFKQFPGELQPQPGCIDIDADTIEVSYYYNEESDTHIADGLKVRLSVSPATANTGFYELETDEKFQKLVEQLREDIGNKSPRILVTTKLLQEHLDHHLRNHQVEVCRASHHIENIKSPALDGRDPRDPQTELDIQQEAEDQNIYLVGLEEWLRELARREDEKQE